jgi:hypothetical protein
MLTVARLTLRRLRSEVVVCLSLTVLLTIATLLLCVQVEAARSSDTLGQWMDLVSYDLSALVLVPILVAIAIGTSVVASEFDRATAVFAWSVAPSRRRWLVDVLFVGALTVLIASLPLAIAVEILARSVGTTAISASLISLDPSAALVLARSVAAFGVTAVVGLTIRRSLPTFLLGLLVTCLLVGAVEFGFEAWREAAALPIDPSVGGLYFVFNRVVDGHGFLILEPYGLEPAARTGILVAQTAATLLVAALSLVPAVALVEERRPV